MSRFNGRFIAALLLGFVIFLSPVNVYAKVISIDTPDPSDIYYNYSYLEKTGDGYMRVFARSDSFVVQYFDNDFAFLSSRSIGFELPLFGGFYSSDSGYYYILTGQQNPSEDDAVEVMRVTKYDAMWNRVSSASIYGSNTETPFAFGSGADFTESGNYLFVHTCHRMYKSSDGLNHQANMSFVFNTSDMSVGYSRYWVSNVSTGYVSHSFNQFAEVDGDNVITVDHGDAYPRSIVLCKYNGSLSTGDPVGETDWYPRVDYVNVIEFAGNIGNNTTHASLGGLAVTNNGYIVVGTSADQSSFDNTNQNVFLAFIPKDLSSSNIQWLTTDGTSQYGAPKIVNVNDDIVAVIWPDNANGNVCIQYFHGNGSALGSARIISGAISSSPVVSDNHLVWYSSNYNSSTVDFYSESLPGECVVERPDGNTVLDPTPISMHRLYNPNSGEHFYTASNGEKNHLSSIGWNYEGTGWIAPTRSNVPVYRLYNPNAGDHHYTASYSEAVFLVDVGWNYEGIGWYSDPNRTVPLYRQYNPNAIAGSHNYTTSIAENNFLVSVGWREEGIAWYGLG